MIQAKLIAGILAQYQLDPDSDHGLAHWARVLENGLRLAQRTGADKKVMALFAVFHDACRLNEYKDAEHGVRGADLAAQLRGKAYSCSAAQFALLIRACSGHTGGSSLGEKDYTVLTCWDSDRLDLPRVGKTIDSARLCTDAGRAPEIISWATRRAVTGYRPEVLVDWEDWANR